MSVRLSVVIPLCRSPQTLRELHRRIVTVLETLEPAFEIIFVEDCGGDDSWQVIELLATLDARVLGIKLARNYGQHNALLHGIRAARGERVVTIGNDLQDLPEEIPKLLARLADGCEVVYGTPENETHNFMRNQASRITKFALQNAMGAQSASKVSALRVSRTRQRDAFEAYRSPTVNVGVLLTWGTTRCGHSAPARRRYAPAHSELSVTGKMSDRLVRLPLWSGLEEHQTEVIRHVLAAH